MERKSIQTGFITDIPKQAHHKATGYQENENVYLKQQVKAIISRLPSGNIIHTAIYNAGLSKSNLMNHLKRDTIPEIAYQLKKYKEELLAIEKEVQKLIREHSEDSEDENEKKRKKL